jgi:hypothetical protein
MTDLLEMLNESIVAAAFERNEITDMRLAERLIWERKSAAARIAELKAALKPFADKADKAEGPFEPPYPVDYSLWRAARAAYLGEKE